MSRPAPTASEHRFGPYTYDPAQRLLFRGSEPVALVPKLIDTLHVLLDRRGSVVEKCELMQLVWPDAVVEESGLVRNISLLRKALGDESEQYIQTVPKRGYRFVAHEPEVRQPGRRGRLGVLTGASAAALILFAYWQFYVPGPLLSNDRRPEIAVLPFESIGPDGASVSHSFNENLVTALAQVQQVRIVSPSTVRRYRDAKVPSHIMARVLGMDAVIEGTIQSEASRVRVTARLVDVHSGRIIWANRYDQGGDAMELSVARSIAADVQPHLISSRESQKKDF